MFIPLQNSSNQLPEISNSLRFDGSNDYLSRADTNNSANQQATFSFWLKRGSISGNYRALHTITYDINNRYLLSLGADDTIVLYGISGASTTYFKISGNVLRDPSSHYHILVAYDSTLTTAEDRIKLFVNGNRITSFPVTNTNPAQNATIWLSNTVWAHRLGQDPISGYYLDGYLSNVCFIDGQAKNPSDFAYTDPNGQWRSLSKTALQSVVNAGGANSFFLPFDDGTSTTTLGNDASSKGNNWTLTNMVRTGGTDDCWSYDTPTNNYATLSAIDIYGGASAPVSNGALNFSLGSSGALTNRSTQAVSSGKYYWELQLTSTTGAYFSCGVVKTLAQGSLMSAYGSQGVGYYGEDGSKHVAGVNTAYGTSYSTPNVIGVALDCDSNIITFYRDGVSQSAITLPFTGESWSAAVTNATGTGGQYGWINFGQRPVASGQWYSDAGGYFRYAPPTGYKALSTKNLSTPSIIKPKEHFDVKLDTGANIKTTTEAVYPSNFFEWIKDRGNSNNHQLIDSVRGASAVLQSNTTAAETTYTAPSGTSVGWVWKAGGAAVSNTAGTITSQVSANPTAGFSIVTFTGTGGAATVGHGLGVAPKMVIMKNRDAAGSWTTGHHGIGNWGETLYLDLTNAKGATDNAWNNTAPTTSVVSVGSFAVNTNKMVLYCFAEVPGFSKIGSYTGNDSTNGPFVWCGFRPKWVLVRQTGIDNWWIFDTVRDTSNVSHLLLQPHVTNVETDVTAAIDFTANGFKVRTTASSLNFSGTTYIFMAFAEAPFKYANAR